MIESLAFAENPVEGNPRARTIHDYHHGPRIARVCQDPWIEYDVGSSTFASSSDIAIHLGAFLSALLPRLLESCTCP
jgi:hypothetical protein